MKGAVLLLVLFISSSNVQGAKILGIFPVAAPSHYILGNSLMRGLAERGHDVTIISPFVEKNPPKNGTYKDIVLTGFVEEHKSLVKKMNMFDMENKNFLFLAPFIIKIMLDSTEKVLSHPNVQNFINSDETFDVVIVEQFMNEAHKAFATHFNAPLILLSTIGASSWPVPYVPNMIDIGGFHVKSPQKLPKDLQEYLDNAKEAHPNVKVFITHGGLLSTLETIYHGVPVLAIPIGADQKLNAQHSANQGFGLMLGYKEVSEATLTDRLKELLSNSKYAKNAKDRSKFFHDRLVSPMETATYWVEYVIRHRGALHLRVAALDLPLLNICVREKIIKMTTTSIFVFVFCLIYTVQTARILGVFPLPGKSHYFLGSALMRELAEKGHDVTVISAFGEKNPPKGGSYTDILLTGIPEEMEKRRNEMNMYEIGDLNPFINIPFLTYMISEIGEMTLKHENVQKLINSGEKFDAVIVEQFYNDAQKALATHFGGVLILFNPIGANYWVNGLAGNPSPPSYVPDTFLSYSSHMTFSERVINTLVYGLNTVVHHFYLYPKQNRVIQQYIPNGPNVQDVLYNASLILLNSHPSINQPVPHVPNMIEIGGFHVKPPKKLPKDLQEFLDSAKDGVIYFSMGSNLRSADLPTEKPHPNVKLFITHGGLLSTTETLYHGVPVLAIPIFGDQQLNAQLAVNNGYGLSLPFKELSENTLGEKLNELLSNPKYSNNARIKSKIFHDRQVTPKETATYWVDYVIRHKGAPHLRVTAVDLPWYKYYLLDIIVFMALIILILSFISYLILRKIFCILRSMKKENKMQKNQ
ncbi:UDPGT and/or Glyco tran 28 C domain containing protein [Asbolus verrucosus]|uniref:UDPGT and/or Glyco tran 28 C domain containing protein n=1 Tax=Asbolus verrucosus TaxID=1661398 RepID=A0A482W9N5_ASBVE|nr:UDPGT and/or Glyco tran 28 C domain containing protein [Asbolus verrucosus]